MSICRFQFKARGKQYVLADEHDQEVARLKAEVERLDILCKQMSKQHSDISCENIMLRKAGDNVVADLEHLTKSGWFNKCKSVKTWLAAKDGKLLK